MKKGIIFGGLLAAAAALWIWAKGTGLKNMVEKLTVSPKLGGKAKLKAGSGNFLSKVMSTVMGSAYLEVPIDIEFGNRSTEEVNITVSSVTAFLNGKSVAESKPGEASVKIAKNVTSKLSGIKLQISTTTLVSVLGSAVTTLLNEGNFDSIINALKIRIGATINNAFTCNVDVMLNKEAGVDTTVATTVSGLGLVASTKRNIKPITDYIQHIPERSLLKREDKIVKINGSVPDTVKIMHQAATADRENVRELAQLLKRNTLKDTLESIWTFVYEHIDYVKDSPVVEQVRRPLRTLYDQKGDCDCYATLIGSMLEALGIDYKFRIAMYAAGYYQHVYVVVPTLTETFVVDPVLDRFNMEKPTVKYMDL